MLSQAKNSLIVWNLCSKYIQVLWLVLMMMMMMTVLVLISDSSGTLRDMSSFLKMMIQIEFSLKFTVETRLERIFTYLKMNTLEKKLSLYSIIHNYIRIKMIFTWFKKKNSRKDNASFQLNSSLKKIIIPSTKRINSNSRQN